MKPEMFKFLSSCENGPSEICGMKDPSSLLKILDCLPEVNLNPMIGLSKVQVKGFVSRHEDRINIQVLELDEIVFMDSALPIGAKLPVGGRAAEGVN